MSLAWRRNGLILAPPSGHRWWASHAQVPTVLPLSDRLWRIYFAARDSANQSQVLAVDVDPGDGMRVVAEHYDALLSLGAPGAFDHRGVLPSSVHRVDGVVRLYYTGIFVRDDVRGAGAIGLALGQDGLAFRRAFEGPIHGIGPSDPFFSVAPVVQAAEDGWRMYYSGGTGWRAVDGVLDPFYELRMTTSPDGLTWEPRSRAVFASGVEADAGHGRAWVSGPVGEQTLWFCRRGERYRAAGEDAYRLQSIRLDGEGRASGPVEPVLFENPPEPGDFDDWMQAYACVLPYGDDLIMIYNGNGFGRTGFGWASMPGGARTNG